MIRHAARMDAFDAAASFVAPPAPAFGAVLARYGISAGGPIAMSGAHFIASLIFLHSLPQAEFGLFSFLLIVVPFCLSMSGALLAPSLMNTLRRTGTLDTATISTHLKANLVVGALAAAAVFALLLASHANLAAAALMGVYGGVMTLRNFGRAFAYATKQRHRAFFSDIAYSALLIAGLTALLFAHQLTLTHAAFVLAAASLSGLFAFGIEYIARQFRPGSAGSIFAYIPMWQEFARWAVFGVILTEFTANAHAYVVTFISGPKAFAVLALGSLLMRPASLVLSALPDVERPRMAAKIGRGDIAGAFRTVKEFRTAAVAMWAATILLAGVLLIWFPEIILKRGYDSTQAMMVLAFWIVIFGVRTLRTPESVFLQAAGEFRALARVSMWSCLVSLSVTLALLLLAGPIVSLAGIIAGDLVITANIFSLTRKWKRAHA